MEARLQRILARAGVASRRASEAYILAGRVSVNGRPVTELGAKADPDRDLIEVDGRALELPRERVAILLNKPAGYVSTMSDPEGRRTVRSLIPIGEHPSLFPIGRLDADTTGALLFTTDGELGHALLHPSHHVEKTYLATVGRVPSAAQLARLRDGIMLSDGPASPCRARIVRRAGEGAVIELSIHEGRYHQVKRMLAAIGCPVRRLHRARFGPIGLSGLERGAWRLLSAEEIAALETAAGIRPASESEDS